MSTPRDELVELHRRLYQRQRRLISQSVQGASAALRAYEGLYRARVRKFERIVPYDEVVRQVAEADVVYVGDYHTLKQAQRSFAKLARRLAQSPRQVVLALEFVQGRCQKHLDDWLARHIDDAAFLARIDYARHQIFGVWPNFKPIFELAREHKLPVVAIDRIGTGPGSLTRRDTYAAERLARLRAEHPDALVLVLVGQLHCAPPHLPRATARALAARGLAPAKELVVYQNAESVYWELTRRGLEHEVEAVEIRPGELCLVNTSPLIAQQSYLDWVESPDDNAEGEDPVAQVEATAPRKHFVEMARVIARYLNLPVEHQLEGVEVYTAGDLSFLQLLRERGDFTPSELAAIRRQILARESYYIPRARIAYLANLSLNHAAEEAAHFVRHAASGGMDLERGLIDSFYARALEEAYAFFGSKIVNPRRKCAHEHDFARLARGKDEPERTIARLVLGHKRLERGERQVSGAIRALYGAADADLFNAVTHALGYILGDKLYYGMLKRKVSKREIRELFLDPLEESGDPFHTYLHLAAKVGAVEVPRRA